MANIQSTDIKKDKLHVDQTLGERKYKILVDTSSDCIKLFDLKGKLLFINKTGLKEHGLKNIKEAQKFSFLRSMVKESQEKFKKAFRDAIKGKISTFEIRHVPKGSNREICMETMIPLKDAKGKIIDVFGISRDFTGIKKDEGLLRESEEKYKIIVEGTADGILVSDSKRRRFIFANPRICEMTGYSLKELFKLGVGDIHPKKDLPYVIDQFTKQMQKKITLANDIPVLRKDKKVVYCDVNSKPVIIKGQEYLVGFFRDITERKEYEEKMKAEKFFSETILNVMPIGLDIVDQDCNIRFMNTTFLDVFGKNALGKKCYGVYKINKKQCDGCPLKKSIKIGETKLIEVSGIVGNKTFLISHTGILFKEKKHILETFMDITEIKKSEGVLRKSHDALERFNKLAVGRELKMIDLKKRIKELEEKSENREM